MGMHSPLHTLQQYWGFKSFRNQQEAIINDVLNGNDTLALLPTGGGKSICFQVPALMQEGICIVISPLIALMKDQVHSLQEKGIKSIALTSEMTLSEMDICLDNCIYGKTKFLYLSPERIENKMVQERLKKMNVNLIAVDEAHCISEWGYDFRLSYLKISKLRTLLDAPILALTATATPTVVTDIQKQLSFKKENVKRSSFLRPKLSYVVLNQDDKDGKLLRILQKVKGSSIVYCNSRRETKRVYQLLKEHSITAHFYHGGLDIKERELKQKQWQQNHVRVMVATNAFGMGIDKPNVRLVVHMQLPYSAEAYFQEAGRAGRDEKMAYAILLSNAFDAKQINEYAVQSFPSLKEIKKVYQHLADYLQLAIGSAEGEGFDFHLQDFCERYELGQLKTYNALKLLEKEGFIKLTDAVNQPSRIYFKMNHSELYQFQINNPVFDRLIKTMLRSYTDLFESFVKIQESIIAKRTGTSTKEVKQYLEKLHSLDIIEYIPQNSSPKLFFNVARQDAKNLAFSSIKLAERKAILEEKVSTIIQYAQNMYQCRTNFLMQYFGESNNVRCGICDVCLERNKLEISDSEFEKIANIIEQLLTESAKSADEIILKIIEYREDKIIQVLQFLYENEQIERRDDNKFSWKH